MSTLRFFVGPLPLIAALAAMSTVSCTTSTKPSGSTPSSPNRCSEGYYRSEGSGQCTPHQDCQAGTFIERPGDRDSDTLCTSCPEGTYSSRSNRERCLAWSECGTSAIETGTPSDTDNRECETVITCGEGWEPVPDGYCAPCEEGTFKEDSNGNSCQPWSTCGDDEYKVRLGSTRRDQACDKARVCSLLQAEISPLTPGANRVCTLCSPGQERTSADSTECEFPAARALRFSALAGDEHSTCGLDPETNFVRCFGLARTGETRPPEQVALSSLVSGRYHHCSLRANDGRAVCWGNDEEGQLTVPADTQFSALAAGEFHTCGLVENTGAVLCWGLNDDGQTTPPEDVSFAELAAGEAHTCGLRADTGEALCWGNANRLNAPEDVAFRALAAGDLHTCGIRTLDGLPQCWGTQQAEMLAAPEAIAFDQLDSWDGGNCGIESGSGEVYCWGDTTTRELRYSGSLTPLPSRPFPGLPFAALTLASGGICGLTRDEGQLHCRGNDNYGERLSVLGAEFVSVSVSSSFTCGIRASGLTQCWGRISELRDIPGDAIFSQVASVGSRICGLDTERHAVCWGSWGPYKPPSTVFEAIDLGSFSACGLRAGDGLLECWGSEEAVAATPQGLPLRAVALASTKLDDDRGCGVERASGEVMCWGDDTSGLVSSAPAGEVTDVSVGDGFACALRAENGTTVCWGSNEHGQTTPPEDVAFDQVVAGSSHACGLRREDGLVQCWGGDDDRVLSYEPPLDVAFSFIDTRTYRTCGVRISDGGIQCW